MNGVIARYGNWFRGDDDLFVHCLINDDGSTYYLGQGLQQVTLETKQAPRDLFDRLVMRIAIIPRNWQKASYADMGYNFITDAEGPYASEIAVYGRKDDGSLADYFVPPAGDEVEQLVKAIADIDK
jgi:hypothetical protein